MAHVSLRDVAARAGVSFQTAGKVLNGKGTVSPATRQRVLTAAADLGYVPNALARSLVTRSTCTLGILAGDLSDWVFAQFIAGAEREARRRGHAVIIATTEAQGSDGERGLRLLTERRVDGILLAAPQLEDDARVGELVRRGAPAVSIHHVAGGGVSLVGSDHVLTALLATHHLIALGHRRIGTITGSMSRRGTHSRLRGYRQALEEAGLPADPNFIETGDWGTEGGAQAVHALFGRAPDMSAIFAQNDLMAIGALSALRDLGRAVPDDCAVVGCDDIQIAARTIPPLTTVHVPFAATGAAAVRLLLDIIAEPAAEPRRELLPVHLVTRVSCGAGLVRSDAPGEELVGVEDQD